jgi:hypothetical protein
MAKNNQSLTNATHQIINNDFDLSEFKNTKGLSSNVKFKQQEWIDFSEPLQKALSIRGIPKGHITLVRGRSDTGKTTMLIELAIEAQKKNILPIFIITEMKWDFSHAKYMGLDLDVKLNEDKTINDYSGFFIYIDRSSINTIEDISFFILDILDEQKKGKLPYDLLFLWDSSGSIPCNMSIEEKKNNPQWNAGAMATQFGNFVNQKFTLSRKATSLYTNTFLVINKTGIMPAPNRMSQPKMTNKGGDTMYWDSTLVITFGNVTNSGTSKIKAIKKGKNVEFAKRTKITIDKIHTGMGIATQSTIIVTPHGFIEDSDASVKKYKKENSAFWFEEALDDKDIIIEEDNSEWNEQNFYLEQEDNNE